jgi:hypothetical protein
MAQLFQFHHVHQLNLYRLRCHWFHSFRSFHWNLTDLALQLNRYLQVLSHPLVQ